MTRDQAYTIAVSNFQREHERWIQNAVVLFGVLLSILLFHSRLSVLPQWLVLPLAIAISAMTVCVSLTIRGSTDAWRKTVRHIEGLAPDTPDNDIHPFEFFRSCLTRYTENGDHWTDFVIIVWGWRRHRLGCAKWRRKVLFSVTRLYTLMAFMAVLVFALLFLGRLVFCWR